MAKQVWAGVMKGGDIRQKEGRNGGDRGVVIGGEIQTHDTCKHGQSRLYRVTKILLKTRISAFSILKHAVRVSNKF